MTESSGLGYRGFCHGIITGDIDNDGDQDVFLCNYGSNVLYLNNGNGTFTDISKAAGIDAPNWSSSGAMIDYDNDGFLDIYVTNYGRWKYPEDHHRAGDPEKKIWLYSSPRTIQTVKHLFFHNNGNNTFTDVYDEGQSSQSPRATLTATDSAVDSAADVNDDGLIDIFVANDMNPYFLFRNRGDGTFDDASRRFPGAAFNINGMWPSREWASMPRMSTATALRPRAVRHQLSRTNMPPFTTTMAKGSSTITPPFSASSMLRTRCPGSRGAVHSPTSTMTAGPTSSSSTATSTTIAVRSASPSTTKRSRSCFTTCSAKGPSGSAWPPATPGRTSTRASTWAAERLRRHRQRRRHRHRGQPQRPPPPCLAPAAQYDTQSGNHWIRFILEGTKSNRDSIGAKVVVTAGGRNIVRQRKGGFSMQSTNDHRVLVGVGSETTVEKAVIRWPSGREITVENLKVDQEYKLVEPKTDTTTEAGRNARSERLKPAPRPAEKAEAGPPPGTSKTDPIG